MHLETATISFFFSKVLFALSVNNFNAVFSRISGRLQELSVSGSSEESGTDQTDIELIQHINVDLARLTKLLQEANSKFKTLKKAAHLALMNSLEKAIWNWMDTYPQVGKEGSRSIAAKNKPMFHCSQEFTELQRTQNEDLARSCDNFFELLDNFAETKNKHRSATWPLQLMLLILTPKVGTSDLN